MTEKEKEQKFISYWENSMQLGRVKYSLINAVLLGIALFLICNIGYYLFTKTTLFTQGINGILSFLICYGLAFLLYYIPIWNVNSFKYNVILKKKKKRKK